MRDLIIFVAVFGMLPFCLARPFFGLLVWSWLGYMNPHRLTWGMAYDFPFVQLVALTTLVGMVAVSMKQRSTNTRQWQREGVLLVMLCIMFVVSTFYSLRPDLAWPELREMAKIMLMAFVTILLVNDEKKLRLLLLVIALSIGFFGFKGGLFAFATGGAYHVYGPPASSLDDNTAIALGMNMILPMLYFLARSEPRRWLRRGLYATFFLTIVAVLFTYSRGGWLGLAVVLGMIALTLDIRKKIAIFVLLMLAFPIVLQQMPDQVVERAGTLQNYQEDGSAQARFGAWRYAWALGLARPLVGGGFQIIDDHNFGRYYYPEFAAGQGGAHSIYFEVLGENGFVALGIFVALLLSAVLSARKIRKIAKRSDIYEFCCYGHMLEVAILAYMVAGAFLEFASFDLFYQLIAIIIVTKVLLQQKLASVNKDKADAVLTSSSWRQGASA